MRGGPGVKTLRRGDAGCDPLPPYGSMRVEKRHGSTSSRPVHVPGHRRVTGGMINDTSHGSEGEVWRVGPDLWGHHRYDYRLCMGGVDHQWHHPKDGRRGGLGSAGGDLRRSIHATTKPTRETTSIRESLFLRSR